MAVGNFGKFITFTVSDRKVLTFRDLEVTRTATWGKTPIIKSRPKGQFLGQDTATATMEVVLDAALGVNPVKIKNRLEKAVQKGKTEYLVVGKRQIGQGKYALVEMSEAYNVVLNQGQVMRMTLTLNFEEVA